MRFSRYGRAIYILAIISRLAAERRPSVPRSWFILSILYLMVFFILFLISFLYV